jgi:uncharacterized membrane protein YfcA
MGASGRGFLPIRSWIAIGFVGGLLSGLLGIGGGVVMVPLMVLIAGLSQRISHAMALYAIIVIAFFGAAPYVISGGVRWDWALALAAGSVIGARIGAKTLSSAPEAPLKIGFGLFLVVAAVTMVTAKTTSGISMLTPLWLFLAMVVFGLMVGSLSGLLGVGGGIFMIPFMVIIAGASQQVAQGTSLVVILPTAIVASAVLTKKGVGDLRQGLGMGAAGAISALAGAVLALHLPSEILRYIFAVLLLFVAAKTCLDGLRLMRQGPSPK